MKKIEISILFGCLMLVNVFCQSPGFSYTPEERAQMQDKWMKENLQLTNVQFEKVSALNLEYARKMEKVKGMDGKMSKIKAARSISNEKDEKLKKVLTEKQFQLYLDKRKELRKQAMEIQKEKQN